MKRGVRLTSLLLLGSVLLLTGAGCGGGGSATTEEKVTLKYWRVFDNDDAFDDLIDAYTSLHPNVAIKYKKLRYDEYEEELIRAIAEGEGPDIFSVHNTQMGEFKSLMLPMPASTSVTYREQQGTIRKEVVVVERETPSISQKELKTTFVDVVAEDVIMSYQPDPKIDPQDRVFGLPLSVDTMALFSNKDLLNAAGIATPPATWQDFQKAVAKITNIDNSGDITQSGAALGTSRNVERAVDILSVLMLQNGTDMIDERGRVAFHTIPNGTPEGVFPGLDAVTFYTDFANPTKEVYGWNEDMPSSFEAFANGQTAFFLGYSYHIPLLRTAAPKLNFSISTLPQIDGGREVNYANYWVESVAKGTKHPDWAWDFIQFATDRDNVELYLNAAKKPTAIRRLINNQLNDEDLGTFVEQLLTAKTWYRGGDAGAAEEALLDLIDQILVGTDEPEEAIENAAKIVAQTYR